MPATRTINAHVSAWLTEHAPTLLEDATLLVAVPTKVIKGAREERRSVKRWFWNVGRVDAGNVLLIALDHTPEQDDDVRVVECYRVPRSELNGRRVVARYRVAKSNRVGSFLDPWKIKVPAWAPGRAGAPPPQ